MAGFAYRVLIVDDEPTIRQTGAAVLGSQGYEVLTAENGLAALQCLDQSLPDVIISDLRMPKMSGFEFLGIVRSRFPQLPVIAISGEYLVSDTQAVLADAVFPKGGFTPDELFTRITDLLAASPLRHQKAATAVAPICVPIQATGNVIITCPKCLRSFEQSAAGLDGEANPTTCPSCKKDLEFFIEGHIKKAIRELTVC